MSTDEYVPSESVIRDYYVGAGSNVGGLRDAAFDRFLARVRRDAAREGYWQGYSDRTREHSYDLSYPEETP